MNVVDQPQVCVAFAHQSKPADVLVWTFSLIKHRWPEACAWREDGEVWNNLGRAYNSQGYRACTMHVNAASPVLAASGLIPGIPTLDIRVEGQRLVVCAEQQLLEQLQALPQWRHRLQPYVVDRQDAQPIDLQTVEHPLEQPITARLTAVRPATPSDVEFEPHDLPAVHVA